MKNWSANSLALVALLGVAQPRPAAAVGATDALACLRRADLVCAEEVLADLPEGSRDQAKAQVWVDFHRGAYASMLMGIDELEGQGIDLLSEDDSPYLATAAASSGLTETVGEGVRVRTGGGVERILVEEALEVLEAARLTYDGLFGGGPDHPVLLEIFPTGSRFIGASGLPPEAVRTTGVIALSKWTRLLLTSPRALARGYGWKDTIAHEYIHLVVSHGSGERAPVWLQEGLAKHLEGAWRGQVAGSLPAHHRALLGDAARTGEFVPFEKFRRSMAYLDSGDEAALAFAQVSTMVAYLLEREEGEVLPALLTRLRSGESAEDVVAQLAGHDDFADFKAGWHAWLRTQSLGGGEGASLPIVLDGGGDDFALDPLLAARADLAKAARLGDLLREAGRPRAALLEYAKAADPEGPPSPLLMARRAACHEALGQVAKALALVEDAVTLYPEFTLLQSTLGRLLDSVGKTERAVEAWTAAHDLNPFDPIVQAALVKDLTALGQADRAARHQRILRVLQTGGAQPISTR
jgi:tetratricopeptide (TPR) repeat protein